MELDILQRNAKVEERGFGQNLGVGRQGVAVIKFCLHGVKLVLENGQLHYSSRTGEALDSCDERYGGGAGLMMSAVEK